ncbi:DUF4190 domain-containing protein [Microtetraspora sp. AC03309]|uniref:hypothetical protein n=1 Tax=Microtetraspora sp. AC03309 TaxID=2779376 RepID=UPI001E65454E|nr:hypothetical protein [Microtetraspora sp. AC03309]MCC5582161.1 DUF4190 domain-containing protein [Microtetraspora sp. AC03309]
MSDTRSRRTSPSRNRPAKAGLAFAILSVAAIGNFFTGIAWLNPGVFVGMAMLFALLAIGVGHVGRYRGRSLDGDGRGMALLSIVLGWLMLFVCVIAIVALMGLIAGLAVIADSV